MTRNVMQRYRYNATTLDADDFFFHPVSKYLKYIFSIILFWVYMLHVIKSLFGEKNKIF
jgi:hypothetical protein